MKRPALPHESKLHVTCPFCSAPVDYFTALTWCGTCFVEWYKNRAGKVVFDDERKTERFAFAKAVCKSGGAKIAAKKP